MSNKTVYALVAGAAAAFFVAIGAGQALAADTYAQYDTLADKGIITAMPGKTAKVQTPRAVNHAQYDAKAARGVYIQPAKDNALTVRQLAEQKNHAQYDVMHDIDG